MAQPTPSPSSHSGEGASVKLPPIRSFEPMSNSAIDASSSRPMSGSSSAHDERLAVHTDKHAPDVSHSNARVGGISSTASVPPSPPPPAPLSSFQGQVPSFESSTESSSARVIRPGESATPSYGGAYMPNRSTTMASNSAPAPWQVGAPASLEPDARYSLERLHAASLSLYNCVGELLNVPGSVHRADDLYAILPIVSEINQEVRTLIPSHDTRSGREAVDMTPYYPWMPSGSGNATSSYWASNVRDDRDAKLLRTEDDKAVPMRGRRSPSQRGKTGMERSTQPRSARAPGSAEDLTYLSRMGPESVGMPHSSASASSSRGSDHAYHTYSAPAKAAQHETTPTSQQSQTYVPKYRKRSRAPAPGVCHSCGNDDTPEWRRGPDGARTLCNACGLHFAKLVRRRTMEYANAAPGVPIPPVTIAELRQSTNVNTNSPSVAQADDERARIAASHAAAAATASTLARSAPETTNTPRDSVTPLPPPAPSTTDRTERTSVA